MSLRLLKHTDLTSLFTSVPCCPCL